MNISKNVKKIFFNKNSIKEVRYQGSFVWLPTMPAYVGLYFIFNEPIGEIYTLDYVEKNNLVQYIWDMAGNNKLYLARALNYIANMTNDKISNDELDEMTKGIKYYNYHFTENGESKIVKRFLQYREE